MKSLFTSSILSLLTIALTDRAFQNYATFEEIEVISSLADGFLHHLRIKKDMLRVPFFRIVFVDGFMGKIHRSGLVQQSDSEFEPSCRVREKHRDT